MFNLQAETIRPAVVATKKSLSPPPLRAMTASPLPATLPAALIAAAAYARRGEIDRTTLLPAAITAMPFAIAGALLSPLVGGPALLTLSGLFLGLLGLGLLRPVKPAATRVEATEHRRSRTIACTAVAAFASGLLANGGAAVLIPLLVLVVGLNYRTAAGTSLLVVPFITLPAVITHSALGHVNWAIAASFAAGAVPAAALGARLAPRVSQANLQRSLGWLLLAFATAFTIHQFLN